MWKSFSCSLVYRIFRTEVFFLGCIQSEKKTQHPGEYQQLRKGLREENLWRPKEDSGEEENKTVRLNPVKLLIFDL